jgi:hypothetical protein
MRTGKRVNVSLRRLAAVLAGLALCISGFVPLEVAGAHTFSAKTTITIHYGYKHGNFYGRVKSSHARCKRHRRVKLYKALRNRPDRLVGRDTTNRRGRYRIHRPHAHGHFYSRVATRVFGRYGHSHECRGSRSPTIRVHKH